MLGLILSVQNIGKIKKADIEIVGVTVITGYNSTGKSSICKALYGIVDSYSNVNTKIDNQRRMSLISATSAWKNQLYEDGDAGYESDEILLDRIDNAIWRLKEINSENMKNILRVKLDMSI